MDESKVSAAQTLRALEITHAYAEYKIRHEGDLDSDLTNWADNIMNLINAKKSKK